MADENVIIVGKLDDNELRDSIKSLVDTVKRRTDTMAESFESAMNRITSALGAIGSSSEALSSGSNKRTSATKNEAQAINETATSYDSLRKAVDAVVSSKSSSQQQLSTEQKITEEIRKQAQAIRESEEYKRGRGVILPDGYVINEERKGRLTIEEQLLNIEKEKARQAQMRQFQEQRELAEKRSAANAAQEQLSVERQITAEQGKRASKTSTPKTFTEYHDLRDAIAHVLQISKSEVKIADESTASHDRLKASVAQLTAAYNRLTASERDSDMGKNLADQIQRATRSLQELRTQMSRPVDLKTVLGMPAKTLDEIAYKIRQLQAYRGGINIMSPAGKQEIQEVNQALDRLKIKQREIMGQNTKLATSNNVLGRSFNYIKNRLAFYFTVGASTQFVRNLIEIRAQYELLEKSIGVLVNSAEQGTRIFNELSQMALVSPYTLIELGQAAKQLVAYDIAAKDVVDTTRRLADMASAAGVPIERLTYALGQIKAYGYLNARDQRMFANAGIPLAAKLAEHYSQIEGHLVTTGDVYDRIKKKLVSYSDVMQVIVRMTDEGGKFFDYQAKMADTLKVQLANLTLAWNNMLNEMGKSNQTLITAPIKGLKELFLNWKNIEKTITSIIVAIGAVKLGRFLQIGFLTRFNHMGLAASQIFGVKLTNGIKAAGASLSALATNPLTWITVAVTAVLDMVQTFYQAREAVAAFNSEIRTNAEERVNELNTFITQTSANIKELQSATASTTPQDWQKQWGVIKEQIENSAYAAKDMLNAIEVFSKGDAMKKSLIGMELIQQLRDVREAMKELDDDTIKVAQDFSAWWNGYLLERGLANNIKELNKELKDTHDWIDILKKGFGDAVGQLAGPVGWYALIQNRFGSDTPASQYTRELDEFTQSVANFNAQRQFSITQEREALAQFSQQFIEQNSLDYTTSVKFRIDAEKSYLAQRRQMFLQELGREGESEYNAWLSRYGERRQIEREFYDWVSRNYRSKLMDMFQGRSIEELKALDWSEKKNREFLEKMAKTFSERTNTSFDELWQLINKTNSMSIEIPVILSVEEEFKSTYQYLTELDSKADQAYNTIKRLQEYLRTNTSDMTQRANAQAQLTAAQREYNEAVAAGGRSRSAEAEANRNARNAQSAARRQQSAANRAAREEESALAKAIKSEIDMVKDLRAAYDNLRKAGVTAADARELVLDGYESTIKHINAVLKKYGVPEFRFESFVGDDVNLTKLYHSFSVVLGKLKKVAKPKEIEALEKFIQQLNVDEAVQRFEKLSDGINAQFEKIKGEYELAIELDAEPQLGELFKQIFNIEDLAELPRDWHDLEVVFKNLAYDYLKSAGIIEEASTKIQAGRQVFTFAENTDLQTAAVTYKKTFIDLFSGIDVFAEKFGLQKGGKPYEFVKALMDYLQNARKKEETETIKTFNNILDKFGDYEYKMSKILEEASRNRLSIITRFGTGAQGAQGRSLYDSFLMADNLHDRQNIAMQIRDLADNVAKDDARLRGMLQAIAADMFEAESALTDWAKLLEKYGDLDVKLTEVLRKSSAEQLNVIRRFGTKDEAGRALDLASRIKISRSPDEIRRLYDELSSLLDEVSERTGDIRIENISTAIDNRQLRETAKAYWDDFKDSDLYAATFDEMANISTQAIEAILAELDKLKDKVKEDPASMKALMKAYNDAQEELIRRKPFESIITSLNEWRSAVEGVKVAQKELDDAIIERTAAQQHLTEVQLARQNEERQGFVSLETHEREVKAMREFEKANKKVTASTVNLRTAESNATAARQRFINSIEASGQALENVSSLLKQFTELLGIAEDSELGMMVEGLSKGFSTMATVLSVVASVAAVAQTSLGWVAAVAAGLSVLVGLVSFLSSRKDTKITKQIEESERAVKRLENSYKNLEYAVEQAYGAVEIGAKKATVANKELQLAELKRQLSLEKSRDSKHKDQNKILDLQGQIIDLEHEIAKASQDIVNDLLDISSVGDFAESLVSEMISAFREGEDYMEKFRDSFSDMIQNMIMKAIVGKVIGMRMQALFNELDAMIDNATKDEATALSNAQDTATWAKDASDDAIKEALRKMDENQRRILLRRLGYTDDYITTMENTHDTAYLKYSRELVRRVREYLSSTQIEEAQKSLNQATEEVFPQLIDYVFGKIPELTQSVDEEFAAAMEKYGDYFNFSETNKELSALQQGIQGITEETAGALEAMLNGVSQQVYLQSDLLRQINTTIQSFDMDVQLANNAQMLLQLQQSYAVQVAIQTTLENWNSSNGRAVRVELVS